MGLMHAHMLMKLNSRTAVVYDIGEHLLFNDYFVRAAAQFTKGGEYNIHKVWMKSFWDFFASVVMPPPTITNHRKTHYKVQDE